MDNLVTIIITSAATAAIVTGIVTIFNNWRQRKHDKKSQIFDAASKLTSLSYEQFWEVQEKVPGKHKIGKPPVMFELMYKELSEIWENGKRKNKNEEE